MDPELYPTPELYSDAYVEPVAGAAIAVMMAFMAFAFFIAIVIYVYMAICLMKMAKKTDTANAWLAWIPILNVILLVQIAKKPLWWIILFFVPFVNIVITIIVWMAVAENLGKPNWLGILMIVPLANLIVPGYLAFSKSEVAGEVPTSPQQPEPPQSPQPQQSSPPTPEPTPNPLESKDSNPPAENNQ